MTDRELLEKAAKAAGYEPVRWADEFPGGLLLAGEQESLNPLTWDGDAFRLAVKLRIDIDHDRQRFNAHVAMSAPYVNAIADGCQVGAAEQTTGDAAAATRRAIVRAAAAIGDSQ